LAFAQQGRHRHIQMLAQQVQQGAFQRCPERARGAQIERSEARPQTSRSAKRRHFTQDLVPGAQPDADYQITLSSRAGGLSLPPGTSPTPVLPRYRSDHQIA